VTDVDLTSPEGIEWVVGLDGDPVRRNLLITQGYHDLSHALFQRLGEGNLNWCSYATWASRTAGRFIRDDEVPAAFRRLLGRMEPIRVSLARANAAVARIQERTTIAHDGFLDLARQVVRDVAVFIGDGNLEVFAELGPIFARLLPAVRDGPEAVLELAATLKPGVTQKGSQSLLRSALLHYAAALREDDSDRRAELMLLANGQVGLHEQIRLQPFIAGSIDAPIRDTLYDGIDAFVDSVPRLLRPEVAAVVSRLFHPIADLAEKQWHEFATKELMTLSLPDGTLVLGEDLPAPRGGPVYPQALDRIDDRDLADLLQQFDADRPDAVGSGAIDWTELSSRMRYILDLFRSRQLDQSLLGQPFTDEQRAAILAGRPVTGEL